MILDTGAERTQLHRRTMMRLGYTEELKTRSATAIGVGGATEAGYMVRIPRFLFLGSFVESLEVAVFDMTYLGEQHIDGLIGWDLIRLLHIEMDGPAGLLKVF